MVKLTEELLVVFEWSLAARVIEKTDVNGFCTLLGGHEIGKCRALIWPDQLRILLLKRATHESCLKSRTVRIPKLTHLSRV